MKELCWRQRSSTLLDFFNPQIWGNISMRRESSRSGNVWELIKQQLVTSHSRFQCGLFPPFYLFFFFFFFNIFLLCFFHYHLLPLFHLRPPISPQPRNHHTVVCVHCSFLNCSKIHITWKLPFSPCLSAQYHGTKYIHVVQPLPPPISRTFRLIFVGEAVGIVEFHC